MDKQRFYGTGKRKNAVARVWLVPGEGNITINGKTLAESCEIGTRLAASVIATKENVCPRFRPEEFGLALTDPDSPHTSYS